MTTTAEPHGFVTRGIHWVSAALIGFGYLKGLDSVSQLADPAVLRFEVLYALGIGAFGQPQRVHVHLLLGVPNPCSSSKNLLLYLSTSCQ